MKCMRCKQVDIDTNVIWLLCSPCFEAFDKDLKAREQNSNGKSSISDAEALWLNKEFWTPEAREKLIHAVFIKAEKRITDELGEEKLPLGVLYERLLDNLVAIGEDNGIIYPRDKEGEIDDNEKLDRIRIADLMGSLLDAPPDDLEED